MPWMRKLKLGGRALHCILRHPALENVCITQSLPPFSYSQAGPTATFILSPQVGIPASPIACFPWTMVDSAACQILGHAVCDGGPSHSGCLETKRFLKRLGAQMAALLRSEQREVGNGKLALQATVLPAKPHNLSSNPGTHMVRELTPASCLLIATCVPWHEHTHTHTEKIYNLRSDWGLTWLMMCLLPCPKSERVEPANLELTPLNLCLGSQTESPTSKKFPQPSKSQHYLPPSHLLSAELPSFPRPSFFVAASSPTMASNDLLPHFSS